MRPGTRPRRRCRARRGPDTGLPPGRRGLTPAGADRPPRRWKRILRGSRGDNRTDRKETHGRHRHDPRPRARQAPWPPRSGDTPSHSVSHRPLGRTEAGGRAAGRVWTDAPTAAALPPQIPTRLDSHLRPGLADPVIRPSRLRRWPPGRRGDIPDRDRDHPVGIEGLELIAVKVLAETGHGVLVALMVVRPEVDVPGGTGIP